MHSSDDNATSFNRRDLVGLGLLVAGVGVSASAPAATAKPAPVEIVPEPAQVAATEGLLEVDGAKLWYWDTGGAGQPVVFLHPATGSGASWVYQQPAFAQAGYRVIGYSRRGHYRSEQVKEEAAFAPGSLTDIDDLRALATQLKLDRFHLIGVAAGGFVAAQYAVLYPETLRSVVLACSLLNIQDPDYRALSTRTMPRNFGSMPPEFRELSTSYRVLNPQGTERWIQIEQQSRSSPRPQMPAAGNPMPAPPSTEGGHKKVTFDTLNAMASQVPTLIMTGDADLYMSPGLLHYITTRVPNAQSTIIATSGHAPFWEQSKAFNRTVMDFTKRARR